MNATLTKWPFGYLGTELSPCFNCYSGDGDCPVTGSLVDVCQHGAHNECLYAIECDRCGVRGPAAFAYQDPAELWNALYARFRGRPPPRGRKAGK